MTRASPQRHRRDLSAALISFEIYGTRKRLEVRDMIGQSSSCTWRGIDTASLFGRGASVLLWILRKTELILT